MLSQLRTATAPSHARLDAAFGGLDLSAPADCARFLSAHALALAPLYPSFRRFVEAELGLPCPDFPAMLQADLAERGIALADLPRDAMSVPSLPEQGAAGICYVIAGSRLGNMVIRKEGYFGRDSGMPSRYMEDDTGHAVWKALVPWLGSREFGATEREAVETAALAAFATFETAFAVSAIAPESQIQDIHG